MDRRNCRVVVGVNVFGCVFEFGDFVDWVFVCVWLGDRFYLSVFCDEGIWMECIFIFLSCGFV